MGPCFACWTSSAWRGGTYGWSANAEGAALDVLDASPRALHRRTGCGRHRRSNRPKATWALDRSSDQRHDRCRHAHRRGGRGGACLAPPRPTPGPATRRCRARGGDGRSGRRGGWQPTRRPLNLAYPVWGRAGGPDRFPAQWVRLGSRSSEQRRPSRPGRRLGIRGYSWSHKTGGRMADDSRDSPFNHPTTIHHPCLRGGVLAGVVTTTRFYAFEISTRPTAPRGNRVASRCCYPVRRWTSLTAMTSRTAARATNSPASISWKVQNRSPGWYTSRVRMPCCWR
jgi:hypothetical protein